MSMILRIFIFFCMENNIVLTKSVQKKEENPQTSMRCYWNIKCCSTRKQKMSTCQNFDPPPPPNPPTEKWLKYDHTHVCGRVGTGLCKDQIDQMPDHTAFAATTDGNHSKCRCTNSQDVLVCFFKRRKREKRTPPPPPPQKGAEKWHVMM